MFYDERINAESGKLYERGIWMATIIGLLYGVLRAGYLAVIDRFSVQYLLTELILVLCGSAIGLIGAIRFGQGGDERTVFEKHRYYLRAGKLFLLVTFSGYALSIPFAIDKSFPDMPTNELILFLEVLGYLYFFYHFKSKEINFNYSFIAEDKRTYYNRVLANIGKLSALLAVAFFFSAMIDLALHNSFLSLWSLFFGYLFSAIGLGLEYLFLSWIEKVSYDEGESERLKKSTFLVGLTHLLFILLLGVVNIGYLVIAASDQQSFSQPVGILLGKINVYQHSLEYLNTCLLAMGLCYLMTQISRSRLAKKGVRGCLLTLAFSTGWSSLSVFFVNCVFRASRNESLLTALANGSNYISFLFVLLFWGWQVFFLYALTKELRMSKWLFLLPLLNILLVLVRLFLVSQSLWLFSGIVENILSVVYVLLGLILLKRQRYSLTEGSNEG